ncbi:MAG: phosphatase PAP2 family protein, partial [Minisyncoccia bacterium]
PLSPGSGRKIIMNNQIFSFFFNLAHKSPNFDWLVVFFADVFPYIVIMLTGLFLVINYKILPSKNPFKEFINKWKIFGLVFFSVFLSLIADQILKVLIHTPRPFLSLPKVHSLFIETGFAFPSGHATIFSALAFSIFFLNKKVGYFFMFFALLIGLARIIAGVHFPVDILGGFILGGGVAYLVKYIFAYFLKNV